MKESCAYCFVFCAYDKQATGSYEKGHRLITCLTSVTRAKPKEKMAFTA